MTAIAPPLTTGNTANSGEILRKVIMPLALLAVCAFFALRSPGYSFLSARNLSILAVELSITAVLALGMLLVILPGHIDLSVGSGVGLLGGIAAVLVNPRGYLPAGVLSAAEKLGPKALAIVQDPWPAPAALAFATVLGVLVWWVMGRIIVKQKVPAFIITLGGLLIFKGLHWWVIQSVTVPVARGGETNLYSLLTTYYIPPNISLAIAAGVILCIALSARADHQRRLRSGGLAEADGETAFLRAFVTAQLVLLFVLICNSYQGVPLPAAILGAVAAVIIFITRQTPFGRYLYAIGGNEEAAVISGVPVQKVTIAAFAIVGLLTAITGFLQTAFAGSSTTTIGQTMELDAVAACVIGGVSLKGGRGTVGGVLLGALIMAVLLNGMTLMAYSPEAKLIIRGTVLAAAVWADTRLGRR